MKIISPWFSFLLFRKVIEFNIHASESTILKGLRKKYFTGKIVDNELCMDYLPDSFILNPYRLFATMKIKGSVNSEKEKTTLRITLMYKSYIIWFYLIGLSLIVFHQVYDMLKEKNMDGFEYDLFLLIGLPMIYFLLLIFYIILSDTCKNDLIVIFKNLDKD